MAACQARLLEVFETQYRTLFQQHVQQKCSDAVRYILRQNILHGDALTLETVGTDETPAQSIVFAEWSAVNGSLLKRRDFVFAHLVEQASHRELPLFSDLDEAAYIPEPVKDYPLIHFLEVGNV